MGIPLFSKDSSALNHLRDVSRATASPAIPAASAAAGLHRAGFPPAVRWRPSARRCRPGKATEAARSCRGCSSALRDRLAGHCGQRKQLDAAVLLVGQRSSECSKRHSEELARGRRDLAGQKLPAASGAHRRSGAPAPGRWRRRAGQSQETCCAETGSDQDQPPSPRGATGPGRAPVAVPASCFSHGSRGTGSRMLASSAPAGVRERHCTNPRGRPRTSQNSQHPGSARGNRRHGAPLDASAFRRMVAEAAGGLQSPSKGQADQVGCPPSSRRHFQRGLDRDGEWPRAMTRKVLIHLRRVARRVRRQPSMTAKRGQP